MYNYKIKNSKKLTASEIEMICKISGGIICDEQSDLEERTISILKSYKEDINTHPWNGSNRHYYIGAANGIYYDFETLYMRGEIYFASKEIAEIAVREAGEENVLRYYLHAIR